MGHQPQSRGNTLTDRKHGFRGKDITTNLYENRTYDKMIEGGYINVPRGWILAGDCALSLDIFISIEYTESITPMERWLQEPIKEAPWSNVDAIVTTTLKKA